MPSLALSMQSVTYPAIVIPYEGNEENRTRVKVSLTHVFMFINIIPCIHTRGYRKRIRIS